MADSTSRRRAAPECGPGAPIIVCIRQCLRREAAGNPPPLSTYFKVK